MLDGFQFKFHRADLLPYRDGSVEFLYVTRQLVERGAAADIVVRLHGVFQKILGEDGGLGHVVADDCLIVVGREVLVRMVFAGLA